MSTDLHLEFPGVMLDRFEVNSATIVQKPHAHDVLRLRVSAGPSYSELSEGAPTRLSWKTDRGVGNFWGYVHRIEPRFANDTAFSEIVCVGTSAPLMVTGTDVWTSVRASDVVRDIARRFRFSADIEPHPRIYNQISQAGDSYWKLLTRLSEETGWVLRVDGATIRFRSRDSLTHGLRTAATDLLLSRDPSVPSEILSFTPQVGAFSPEFGEKSAAALRGIDPTSGKVFGAETSAEDLRFRRDRYGGLATSYVTRSMTEAESAARAAHEKSRLAVRAKLRSIGDVNIRPEHFVNVRGVSDGMGGTWVVIAATHEITPTSYTCTAELGTDGLGKLRSMPGETAAIPGTVNPHRPGAVMQPLTPVLIDHRTVLGAGGGPNQGVYWSSPVINWR